MREIAEDGSTEDRVGKKETQHLNESSPLIYLN